MKQKRKLIKTIVLTALLLLSITACGTSSGSPLFGTWKSSYITSESAVIGYKDATLVVNSDGTCVMKDKGEKDVEGIYRISPDTNTVTFSFGVKLGGFTGQLDSNELRLYNNHITIIFEK